MLPVDDITGESCYLTFSDNQTATLVVNQEQLASYSWKHLNDELVPANEEAKAAYLLTDDQKNIPYYFVVWKNTDSGYESAVFLDTNSFFGHETSTPLDWGFRKVP